jgi:hypothetical protein
MRVGDVDGLEVVYDDEAQLILSERERVYGRRGLTIDAYEVGRLSRKPFFETGLWMVYYTNQRIVGLRDMTKREEEVYLGTLRPIDRTRFIGPQAEEHHVLRYFEFPLKDIVTVDKSGNKYLKLVVASEDGKYEFRFRPWGAACRFFSILLRKEEAE